MDRYKILTQEKHLIRFDKDNEIKYGQDHQFWQGIPSDVDFRIETLGDKFVLTAYGYGQLEPHDEHSYGNGKLYLFDLTEEQKAFFKQHSVGHLYEIPRSPQRP